MTKKIKFVVVGLVVGSVLSLAFIYLNLEKKSAFDDRDFAPLRKKYTHQIINNLNWQVVSKHGQSKEGYLVI